jgi:hypothetical protein
MQGNKVSIHRSTDAGTTYGTAIASIIGLEPGEEVTETVDGTAYGSGHDFREYDYGLSDGGEWNLTIRYKEGQTDVEAFIDARANSTKEYIQVQFPAPISKTKSFRCLVTKAGMAIPKEGQVDRMVTLKVDGPVTDGALV